MRAPTTPQRVVLRSRIVLMRLDGMPTERIARQLRVSRRTVNLWISRFAHGGAEALMKDAPGRGRPSSLDTTTLLQRLKEANLLRDDGHPISLRRAAIALGVSASALWRAYRKIEGR
jgi:transposase